MMAIQIAALITIGAGIGDARSLQQLFVTRVVLTTIAVSGMLPITFILLCLQSAGDRSWYMLILSICTVAVSVATFYRTQGFSVTPDDIASIRSTVGPLDQCGNRDPSAFCWPENEFPIPGSNPMTPFFGSQAVVVGSFLVLIVLFIDRLNMSWTNAPRNFKRTYEIVAKPTIHALYRKMKPRFAAVTSPTFELIRSRVFDRSEVGSLLRPRQIIIELIYLLVWVWYLVGFGAFFSALVELRSSGLLSTNDWSFGQIVSITIWAEPLFEYLRLQVRGMNKGFSYRVAGPYHVVLKDEHDPADKASDDSPEYGDAKTSNTKFHTLDSTSTVDGRADETDDLGDSTRNSSTLPEHLPIRQEWEPSLGWDSIDYRHP